MKYLTWILFIALLDVGAARAQAEAVATELRARNGAHELAMQESGEPDDKALIPSVCFPPSPLPSFPDQYSNVAGFIGRWGSTDRFAVTFWRQPCSPGSLQTYLYLRIQPTQGIPFICGGSFAIVQGGTQLGDVKLTLTRSGSSFCGDLFAPTTFLVQQWNAPYVDENQALTLHFSGVYSSASTSLPAYTGGVASSDVVEFHHAGFDHYFISANANEIAALSAGAFGGAWKPTYMDFQAYLTQAAASVPVCRFFSASFGLKSSHFYTANPVECNALKSNPQWTYEGIAFYVNVPDAAGTCPSGTENVYRMYNNGQGGAPNHRFTTNLAIRNQFVTSKGWIPEGAGPLGVGFCAPL